MRVIAGIYGSRKLRTLSGLAMRPSSDRLRETLFNVIGEEILDSVFLDLFAGSGAVGIEALSRGAKRAIFVENHRAGVELLRANLRSLGISIIGARGGAGEAFGGTAEICAADASKVVEQLAARGVKVDLAFADPPYADSKAYENILDLLGDSSLLPAGAHLILEHERRRELPATEGQLERVRILEQGSSALSFYRVARAA